MNWNEESAIFIDVRGLEPPQPMVAVLKLLEAPDTGDHVLASFDREPIYLYPELAERGWAFEPVEQSIDAFQLRLIRQESE